MNWFTEFINFDIYVFDKPNKKSYFATKFKYQKIIEMKKENKIGKKLSLKKLQITKLNLIRGGDGNDNGTNGDTTSQNCPPKLTKPTKPTGGNN